MKKEILKDKIKKNAKDKKQQQSKERERDWIQKLNEIKC